MESVCVCIVMLLSWRYQYCQYIVILGSSQFNTANIPHTLHNLYTAGHYTGVTEKICGGEYLNSSFQCLLFAQFEGNLMASFSH